jgi:dTDP-L-rhamnose 4-epimerase
MASRKKVLITGGAGFIGCAISHLLAKDNNECIVLDNLHPQVHKHPKRPLALDVSAQLIVGDVTNPTVWNSLFGTYKPDVIIHLAAETGTGQSLSESSRHANVNVCGTTQMLDAITRHNYDGIHFILASSRAVYGEGLWENSNGELIYVGQRSLAQLDKSIWEDHSLTPKPAVAGATKPAPTSIYGATKYAQELILNAWCAAHTSRLTILRLQNVYGRGQSLINSYTGIVALFSQLAREGKSIPLYEDGNMIRDFVHISDVARAFVCAMLSELPRNFVCDIGSGKPTTLKTVAQELSEHYGSPSPHITGQFRNGDIRHAMCEIASAWENLHWSPEIELREGLKDLQLWINQEFSSSSGKI